ncbi:META domain-containing protein [Ornithinimicrobium sp. W1665]|uniref:META domain-containing protein n=1 Tax=Ornithinimicrobium sp. W1665 TaxID=3416666 RepID=UPI003D6BA79A
MVPRPPGVGSGADDAEVVPTTTLDDGEVSGHSGVNRFGGTCTWRADGSFEVEDVIRTAVGGTEEQMAMKQKFFDALEAARHYEVAGTRMRLSDGEGGDLLVLDPQGPGGR